MHKYVIYCVVLMNICINPVVRRLYPQCSWSQGRYEVQNKGLGTPKTKNIIYERLYSKLVGASNGSQLFRRYVACKEKSQTQA